MSAIIGSFSEISDRFDAAFVDLWGCMHNGVKSWPEAIAAMRAFRARGGKVILVTNSPRPRREVEGQIAAVGLPEDCWDAIASSGDSARAAMYEGVVGHRVWVMGDDRDDPFFAPMKLVENPVTIDRVPLDEAEGIVCCSPFDETADPEVNEPQFREAIDRGLKLLCANPDIVVDRGDDRVWCAGALARLYSQMGGESLYFGKPHAPIYDLARRRLSALGADVPDDRIVCIGDGIHTDIRGAADAGLASLFITGGLAAEETGTDILSDGQPKADLLDDYLAEAVLSPDWAIGFLR
ncbi:TIGR01459 family HAD-type hydrolase [Pseudoroseicyclus aestuarii]|uniref:HAD superfamily hydrolase (TIGR01459 family) n=1 Tax=Pseudoroseicyclus aestuarii TaxID=1795041 RepID=A0A318SP64_9RHOB|nr:TIGR01459 family HAD-type hydrolase [Pseudoroseicyclus aestuarii]PYE82385.1 HAD superfamily hydrolase (TIGR01459 family) [Pseudoroseicyclus aestuarii]